MFHREGYQTVTLVIMFYIGAILLTYTMVQSTTALYWVVGVGLIPVIAILQFFRNPKREAPNNPNMLMSPVDGKVVVIEEVEENEYFKDKRIQISIFMSPINVHVTRHPGAGQIVYNKYHPGKYLVAWHPKASEENERTTVVVKTKNFGKIMYRQIAGAVAKRIINYAVTTDRVEQGDESGFIRFGSRVDVFIPRGAEINVKLNQKVKGAETPLASVPKE